MKPITAHVAQHAQREAEMGKDNAVDLYRRAAELDAEVARLASSERAYAFEAQCATLSDRASCLRRRAALAT